MKNENFKISIFFGKFSKFRNFHFSLTFPKIFSPKNFWSRKIFFRLFRENFLISNFFIFVWIFFYINRKFSQESKNHTQKIVRPFKIYENLKYQLFLQIFPNLCMVLRITALNLTEEILSLGSKIQVDVQTLKISIVIRASRLSADHHFTLRFASSAVFAAVSGITVVTQINDRS